MKLRTGLLMIGTNLLSLGFPSDECRAHGLDIDHELNRLGYPTANFFNMAPQWFHEADSRLEGSFVRPEVRLEGVREQRAFFEYNGVLRLPLQFYSIVENGSGPEVTPYLKEKETKAIYLHEYGHAYFTANATIPLFNQFMSLQSARDAYIEAKDRRLERDKVGYLKLLKQLCSNLDDERLLEGEKRCWLLPRWQALLAVLSTHQELFADAFSVILMNDASIISQNLAEVFPSDYMARRYYLRSFLPLYGMSRGAAATPEICQRDGVTEYACTYASRRWIWSRYQATQLTPAAFLKKLLGLLEASVNTDLARRVPASRGEDILNRLKEL